MNFLRKYQSSLYAVITVLILCSFFFFGSNSTIQNTPKGDTTSFYDVSKTPISHKQLEQMIHFITSDQYGFLQSDGSLGSNFLNSGDITKLLLSPSVGSTLLNSQMDKVQKLISDRKGKEKNFQPYQHPSIPYISLKNLWQQYALPLSTAYNTYHKSLTRNDTPIAELLENRLQLMQAHNKISPSLFKRVLLQQQNQYEWIPADNNLYGLDLSLFGYNNLVDWLGHDLTRHVAETIYNIAAHAKQIGYVVDDTETEVHLKHQLEVAYQFFQRNPNNPKLSLEQFYNKQLAILNMTETQVKDLCTKTLLAEKFLNERTNAVLIKPTFYKKFLSKAYETLVTDCYSLKKDLQFADNHQMHLFEIYLSKTHQYNIGTSPLLPPEPLSIEETKRKNPEFIVYPVQLSFRHINKDSYAQSINLKTLLEKQTESQVWQHLVDLWPNNLSYTDNTQQILDQLKALDEPTRSAINQYTRLYILNTMPNWIEKALSNASIEVQDIEIPEKSYTPILSGISDTRALVEHLSQLSTTAYSEDGVNYYLFEDDVSIPSPQLISFKSAYESGLLDKYLTAYINANSDLHDSELNPNERNSQRELEAFAPLHDLILKSIEANIEVDRSEIYPYRFYSWLSHLKHNTKWDQTKDNSFFGLESEDAALIRKDIPRDSQLIQFFNAPIGSTSNIVYHPEHSLCFFSIKEKKVSDITAALNKKVNMNKEYLKDEILSKTLESILEEVAEKKAYSEIN